MNFVGNGSILVWRTENHTQATFPTKSGRSSPRTWRSFERMRPSASTTLERSSMDCGGWFAQAHRGATCLTTRHPGRLYTSRRSGGFRRAFSRRWSTICAYCCAFRRAERQSIGRRTRLAHPRLYYRERLSGRLRSQAKEGFKGPRKVHAAVDTLGHLLALHVSPANEQERAHVGSWPRLSKKRPVNRWSWHT